MSDYDEEEVSDAEIVKKSDVEEKLIVKKTCIYKKKITQSGIFSDAFFVSGDVQTDL